MKKTIAVLLFSAMLISQVFSGGFHFEVVPEGTLYPEYFADPYSADSTLGIIYMTDAHLNTARLQNDDSNYGTEYKILDSHIQNHWADNKLFINGKFGISNGLFRFGYDGIFDTELQVKGLFNTVFDGFSHSDQETFDGIANFAINLRLFNIVTLHGGLFHYSGHVADEAILNMAKKYEDGNEDKNAVYDLFSNTTNRYHFLDYCNDNLYTVAISATPLKGIRLFSELQWMPQKCSVGPSYLWRNDRITSWGDESYRNLNYPDYYKGYISISGIDLQYTFWKVCSIYAGGIIKFHQNGQTVSNQTYNENAPWEMEWGASAGFRLLQKDGTGSVQLYISYFDGRFPGTSYFNIRTKYYKVGLSFSM